MGLAYVPIFNATSTTMVPLDDGVRVTIVVPPMIRRIPPSPVERVSLTVAPEVLVAPVRSTGSAGTALSTVTLTAVGSDVFPAKSSEVTEREFTALSVNGTLKTEPNPYETVLTVDSPPVTVTVVKGSANIVRYTNVFVVNSGVEST